MTSKSTTKPPHSCPLQNSPLNHPMVPTSHHLTHHPTHPWSPGPQCPLKAPLTAPYLHFLLSAASPYLCIMCLMVLTSASAGQPSQPTPGHPATWPALHSLTFGLRSMDIVALAVAYGVQLRVEAGIVGGHYLHTALYIWVELLVTISN